MSVVEIRTLKLKPGAGADFERLYTALALPLLQHWGFDVVAHGRSRHDADAYYVMRAYNDVRSRQIAEDAYYGSDDWRGGPREAMLALIEVYIDTVLPLRRETAALAAQSAGASRTLEIRAYQLKQGAGPAFARVFRDRAQPMLRAHGMDVVGFGQSLHDANCYYLMRAFDTLEHLTQAEDDFYGSDAWREGPRVEVLDQIETYADTVLALSPEAIEAIRRELS